MITRYFIVLLVLLVSIVVQGQTNGCTDPLANNYNAAALINDGSCTYNFTTISPVSNIALNDTLSETSGLVWWNGYMWTHNDNLDLLLYALDTATGKIVHRVMVHQSINEDWEDVTQDSNYFYIGDFGNNANGNRQNLRISRVSKTALSGLQVPADTISFHYSDQVSFSAAGPNNTDFDCEAIIVVGDSIYLFTKQWVSKATSCYVLPKTPGSYTAQLRSTSNVQGLVTGATYIPGKNATVLSGYEINGLVIQPFVYLLYDYKAQEFFGGNKRKIYISELMSQVEGIATADGLGFFISNEAIINSILTIYARLQKIDLAPFLQPYYQSLSAPSAAIDTDDVQIYPNPTDGKITLTVTTSRAKSLHLSVRGHDGKMIWFCVKPFQAGQNTIALNLPDMASGFYWLNVSTFDGMLVKKISFVNR
jgi:hypothetical protein